jgi:hypothetical protein
MRNINISSGSIVTSNKVDETTISNIFEKIKNDNTIKANVEKIRQLATDPERRDAKVKLLPYFVGATFTDGIRKNENLVTTEMMILDFDHVGEKYDSLNLSVRQDPETFFAFCSPSGDGIKVGYLFEQPVTSNELYEAVYLKYKEIKEIQYGVDADEVTKNVSRACFLSYDPELYVNENASPLIVSDIQVIPKQQCTTKLTPMNMVQVGKSKTKYVPTAIEFLRLKINNYDDWMRCGFALATLGDEGRSYFHILSSNPNYNDSFEEVNDKFDNFLQTSKGDIGLATLFEIAKCYGFDYPELAEYNPINTKSVNDVSVADQLRDRFAFDDQRDPNKLLGYPLDKFHALAKNIDGIQPGFYLISADSNVGKTAFLTNLCLDLMLTNPDVKVVYFSLDDSKFYSIYRLLSILTQFHINDVRKKNPDPNKQHTLNSKRDLILDLVESGRLIIKDLGDLNHIDQLVKSVETIGSFDKMVVFVDGMYNLNVEAKEGIRMENIKRAATIKEIVDKYNIPVIATGELRKKTKDEGASKKPTLHDLSETGKYSYNANVVWLLYPVTAAQLKEDQSALILEFAKNKLSDFKGIQDINFIRATGTMEENNLTAGFTSPTTPFIAGGDLD